MQVFGGEGFWQLKGCVLTVTTRVDLSMQGCYHCTAEQTDITQIIYVNTKICDLDFYISFGFHIDFDSIRLRLKLHEAVS